MKLHEALTHPKARIPGGEAHGARGAQTSDFRYSVVRTKDGRRTVKRWMETDTQRIGVTLTVVPEGLEDFDWIPYQLTAPSEALRRKQTVLVGPGVFSGPRERVA